MKRREFLSLGLKTTAVLAASSVVGAGIEARDCGVTRREIILPGLPAAFDGFRVAHLSDLHHSRWISQPQIGAAVDLTNSLQPDLVALTGDYISHGKAWVAGCMAELARLRAPYGVVGVLGNHDNYHGAREAVRQGLWMARIMDLTNAGIPLQRDGQTFWIGGVGDLWTESQNLAQALSSARGRESALLLTHNPDFVEEIRDERVGLVLSGHTHGGQVVLPIIGAPLVPSQFGSKYVSGLCQGPQAQVFVTRGIGTIFPPVRFRCPAEVALLTLRSAS